MTYHIADGKPKPCQAKPGNCPVTKKTGEPHFNTPEESFNYIKQKYEQDLTPGTLKSVFTTHKLNTIAKKTAKLTRPKQEKDTYKYSREMNQIRTNLTMDLPDATQAERTAYGRGYLAHLKPEVSVSEVKHYSQKELTAFSKGLRRAYYDLLQQEHPEITQPITTQLDNPNSTAQAKALSIPLEDKEYIVIPTGTPTTNGQKTTTPYIVSNSHKIKAKATISKTKNTLELTPQYFSTPEGTIPVTQQLADHNKKETHIIAATNIDNLVTHNQFKEIHGHSVRTLKKQK